MKNIARVLVLFLTLMYVLFANENVKKITEDFYFRLAFIVLIVLSTVYDPLVALMLSILFIFNSSENILSSK